MVMAAAHLVVTAEVPRVGGPHRGTVADHVVGERRRWVVRPVAAPRRHLVVPAGSRSAPTVPVNVRMRPLGVQPGRVTPRRARICPSVTNRTSRSR